MATTESQCAPDQTEMGADGAAPALEGPIDPAPTDQEVDGMQEDVEALRAALQAEREARRRAEQAADPLAAQLAERDAALAALNERLETTQTTLRAAAADRLQAIVLEACARTGVRGLSQPDAVRAARECFHVDEGLTLCHSARASGSDASTPASRDDVEQWLVSLRDAGQAAWWDIPAAGGASPARSVPGLDNPFAADSFNLTKQGQMLRDNPDLALRLWQSAG